MRDLEAATAREKAAQDERNRVAEEHAEAQLQENAQKKAEVEPVNVLRRGYATYIVAKRYHEPRDGDSAVWINDVEAERAKMEISTIESKLNAGPPSQPPYVR